MAKESLCNTCNSKTYCANRMGGVKACINYNKFPKPTADEGKQKSITAT